jgi:hypothetical protein
VDGPESRLGPGGGLGDDFPVDEHGNPVGMFGGRCEFCGESVKAFPTLEEQRTRAPQDLYCCEDYREFVEFAVSTSLEIEEENLKANQMIDVKPHAHHGSKSDRRAARERAVQR